MRLFIYENAPFIYRLSYHEKRKALCFLINSLYLEQINAIWPENLIIKQYDNLQDFKFEANIEKNFGFNNCSVNRGITNGLLCLEFPIKPSFYFGTEECTHCEGTGEYEFGDGVCYDCRGTGKETIQSFSTRDSAHSIYVLIRYLNSIASEAMDTITQQKDDRPITQSQLLYVQTFCAAEMNGHPIGSAVSHLFVKSIFSQNTKIIAEKVEQAMIKADQVICNEKNTPKYKRGSRDYEFNCWIRDDYQSVHIQVPGTNDCCIHIDNEGELTCHNVDSSTQQLELLIGLAVICDFVMR